MSIEIGIMVVMCAIAAAGITVAWYYYDQYKQWRESYEDIEREYRAESHIWHNRIAELERKVRWNVETTPGLPQARPWLFDLITHLRKQIEFSQRTFGPGYRTAGIVDHIRKELAEIEKSPCDLEEWIDVIILACDGAWRAGFTPEQIVDQLAAKLAKNTRRKWPDWRTADPNRAIEHVRDAARRPGPVTDWTGGTKPSEQPLSPNTQDFLTALYGDDCSEPSRTQQRACQDVRAEHDDGFSGRSDSSSSSSSSDSSTGSTD